MAKPLIPDLEAAHDLPEIFELAKSIVRTFMTKLVHPIRGWDPPEDPPLELVRGFDRSSTDHYIR